MSWLVGGEEVWGVDEGKEGDLDLDASLRMIGGE